MLRYSPWRTGLTTHDQGRTGRAMVRPVLTWRKASPQPFWTGPRATATKACSDSVIRGPESFMSQVSIKPVSKVGAAWTLGRFHSAGDTAYSGSVGTVSIAFNAVQQRVGVIRRSSKLPPRMAINSVRARFAFGIRFQVALFAETVIKTPVTGVATPSQRSTS